MVNWRAVHNEEGCWDGQYTSKEAKFSSQLLFFIDQVLVEHLFYSRALKEIGRHEGKLIKEIDERNKLSGISNMILDWREKLSSSRKE